MAGTRRSTRKATLKAPKYAEENTKSVDEAQAHNNGNKSTRRKRERKHEDEDDFNTNESDSPPPKKVSKREPKHAKTASTKGASKPASSNVSRTPTTLPAPSDASNRDSAGNQEVFWLLKAEPLPRYENGVNVAFSIDDLKACKAPEPWSGVRNPQARNNMQAMRKGDLGFFYHSNAKPSGVVGILRVVEEAKVDETAFDSKDPYYDGKSNREKPKWYCVGVEFVKKFDEVVDLAKIKSFAGSEGPLSKMQLVTNSRLSVSKVSKTEWSFIVGLAEGNDVNDANSEAQELA